MDEREALQRVLEMAENCTYIDLSDKRHKVWDDAMGVVEAMLNERGGYASRRYWDGSNTENLSG